MEQMEGNQTSYRLVNRWMESLKLTIQGPLPKTLAEADQVLPYRSQACEETKEPETIGLHMGPRPLTAEEWQHLHSLPDFQLLLDWLSRDHFKLPPQRNELEGQSGPDAA